MLDEGKNLINAMSNEQALGMIETGVIQGGMFPKVKCCLKALRGGVGKAHIIDGRLRHAVLLEMFTDRGIGRRSSCNEERKGTRKSMEKELMALAGRYLMGTYNRYPIVLERGSGTRVWDTEGREYLDFVAGIAVCSLGHAHPHVTDAIRRQAETLVHVSNLYFIETQIRYAAFLMSHAFEGKVFFCNSGAEANEAAIKLARKYGNEVLGQGCNEIVSMKQSFHGRTLATVAATGQEKIQKGFDSLPGGFTYAPFNDLAALEGVLTNKTCAVLLEPIQGESGVRIPDAGYLSAVRRLCRERGILLIFDEVQVGMGRTGRLFAHEHDGVTPDVMTLAKALGNGMPVGAMVASDRIAATFTPGSHASTFGGNRWRWLPLTPLWTYLGGGVPAFRGRKGTLPSGPSQTTNGRPWLDP